MKKIFVFVFAFAAVLFAGGALLSCSNGSDSPMVGGIGIGVTQTGDGGTTTTTSNEPTAAENAKVVVAAIKALTESGTIKATGKLDNDSIREINAALKELASRDENILVTLDLSEVTGLTELEGKEYGHSTNYLINSSHSFCGCKTLAGVVLPSAVTKIGDNAFRDCAGLKSIMIPDGVNSIGGMAFYGCSKIKSITIPDSVAYIGGGAFSGCVGLEEMTLPFVGSSASASGAYVTSRFGFIFGTDSCSGAVAVNQYCVFDYATGALGSKNCTWYLPEGLKKVKITGGVFTHRAFENCSMITEIITGAKFSGTEIFSGCTGLMSVTILDGVTSICGGAFSGCTGLTSVTIPGSVTSIGYNAFNESGLTSFNYTGTLAQWCAINFASNSNPCYYTQKLCIQGQEIIDLDIPDGVKAISPYAFYNCTGLTSVTIPSGVTSIDVGTFYNCTELASVTIPSSVTSIHSYAFYRTGLKNLTIPNGVISIGSSAFYCSRLTSVTISDTVTSIGKDAFYGCGSLSDAYFFDTNNWHVNEKNTTYTLDSASLADPTIAAKCLRGYDGYDWYKL